MSYKDKSGACEKCGNWTGHGQRKLCADCRNKAFATAQLVLTCAMPGCEFRFVSKRGSKYCFEHKGMRVAVS